MPLEPSDNPIAIVLALIPAGSERLVAAEQAAITLASQAINNKLADLGARNSHLDRAIVRRKRAALWLKGVSLLGGALILFNIYAPASRWIGLAIVLAGLADMLFGNHQRMMDAINERNGNEQLLDSVEDATAASIRLLRGAGTNALEALKVYADFMQQLQSGISQGVRAVREAARVAESALLAKLELPAQPQLTPPGKDTPDKP